MVFMGVQGAFCAETLPWWKQHKIVFMWGGWDVSRADKSRPYKWEEELPRDLFRNVALAGGTVFVASRGAQAANARLAHEFGLKYFANKMANGLPGIPGRNWVQQNGEEFPHPGYEKGLYWFKCPLDESIYRKWLVEPFLDDLKAGHIDGIHTDWEHYSGGGEPKGICYCESCFSGFPGFQAVAEGLPKPADRYPWLERHDLVDAYAQSWHKRRVEMFTVLRKELQAIKPDLLFSCYNLNHGDFTQAMNTPQTPLIYCDQRFYYSDDRKPWWESHSERLKREGYLYIPGGWTLALFGGQPSQVSAATWIYEAAANEDGVWLWFERELDDEILRAYSTADARLKAVEGKVGRFLFQGTRDLNFVTTIEWTGRTELEKAVIQRSYHLGVDHLAHISNTDTQWPIRVRLKFPRLPADKKWTIRDAMAELYYSSGGKSPVWTSAQLKDGLVVSMEPRSDVYLVISPAEGAKLDGAKIVPSREFSTLPSQADVFAKQGPVDPGPAVGPGSGLLYTATEPMGFEGSEGPLTIGNAISRVDLDGSNKKRLRQVRGHLWSASWSPDGYGIAFVHDAGGRGQICVMNSDGSGVMNLSNNAFCDRYPVWSPDGKKIAFASDRSGDWDIWVMNSDGSGQKKLAGNVGVDRSPTWSPDGKRIAWESHVIGIPNIWTCDSDGKNPAPLISSSRKLKLHQVFSGDVSPDFPDNSFWLMDPVWSPDGKSIAAVELGHMSADHLVVVISPDGSRLTRLTPSAYLGGLCWSPDSSQLAGWSRSYPGGSERSGIFAIKVDGTYNMRWLIEARPQGPRLGGIPPSYDWKPGNPAPADLATWYSHGSALPTRLLKTFGSISWSPDGKSLAFSSDMDPTGAFYVYTIPAEGGTSKRLDSTKSAWPNEVDWRPK